MGDAALVEATLAGDAGGFDMLYRAHVVAVVAVVRDNVHGREAVADLVQEVFTRALARLGTLQDAERFRPWLLSIARHAAIDHRRSGQRTPVPVQDGAFDADAEPSTPDTSPEEIAEVRELSRLVRGCVNGLSKRDATALSLVADLGLSPADVGAALGVTPGAAKVIVHRARRRLREALSLELLVRSRVGGCDTFNSLRARGQLIDAVRHTRSCPTCSSHAQAAVREYDSRVDPERSRATHSLRLEPLDPHTLHPKGGDQGLGKGGR